MKFQKIPQISMHIALLLGSVIMLFPLVWMISSSFKNSTDIMSLPPTLIPDEFIFSHYVQIFKDNFGKYTFNSFVVASLRTIFPVYTSALLGYIIDKFDFKGKNFIFILAISTMMVPYIVTFIPLYNLMNTFHLLNTWTALYIPFIVYGFGVFLMRSFMYSIPNALIESARIDGCNEFSIFHRIVFPLVLPAIASLGIICFIGAWDDFLWPFLVANNADKYTLSVALQKYSARQRFADYGPIIAGSVISSLPMLIVFFILQKKIVEGITFSGIKG